MTLVACLGSTPRFNEAEVKFEVTEGEPEAEAGEDLPENLPPSSETSSKYGDNEGILIDFSSLGGGHGLAATAPMGVEPVTSTEGGSVYSADAEEEEKHELKFEL